MEEHSETRNQGRSDDDRRQGRDGRMASKFKKRVCRLCSEKTDVLDYKKTEVMVKFVSNKGKILPRRLSGSCARHQRVVATSIKRARAAGFMPYSPR
ncbi:MAG: 30S ribosomal protein S18 [Spirochaetia bacterium]|nr:30S ribosomal protein S18 [Spirochaetia bacterium]